MNEWMNEWTNEWIIQHSDIISFVLYICSTLNYRRSLLSLGYSFKLHFIYSFKANLERWHSDFIMINGSINRSVSIDHCRANRKMIRRWSMTLFTISGVRWWNDRSPTPIGLPVVIDFAQTGSRSYLWDLGAAAQMLIRPASYTHYVPRSQRPSLSLSSVLRPGWHVPLHQIIDYKAPRVSDSLRKSSGAVVGRLWIIKAAVISPAGDLCGTQHETSRRRSRCSLWD